LCGTEKNPYEFLLCALEAEIEVEASQGKETVGPNGPAELAWHHIDGATRPSSPALGVGGARLHHCGAR
jgi:hypothetical protein